MKKAISAGCILFLSVLVHAQKTSSAHLALSFNGGISSPLGNISKGDYADEKSGFIKTGYHFNVSGVYYLSSSFGIGALAGYSQFGFAGSQSLADGYKEDSGTDSTTLYHKGNNTSLSFMVGPYYTIPVSSKFSVDLRLLGGYTQSRLAGFQIFYEDYLDNVMTQKASSAGSFGYQAGAAVRYKITDKIAVQANADYFSSKPKFNISYQNFIVNSGRRLSTYNESAGGVNATIGVAFNVF